PTLVFIDVSEQYFAGHPKSRRRPAEIQVAVRGHSFRFQTDAGVFSRKEIDRGTELLLAALEVGPCELILDLGCGYGVLGIVAARLSEGGHVILTDVNERAVALAGKNVAANGIANAEVRFGDLYEPVRDMAFDHIVCNPPIRAGRAVVDRIVTEAPMHLLDGGKLWLVARTRQGAGSLRERMAVSFNSADEPRTVPDRSVRTDIGARTDHAIAADDSRAFHHTPRRHDRPLPDSHASFDNRALFDRSVNPTLDVVEEQMVRLEDVLRFPGVFPPTLHDRGPDRPAVFPQLIERLRDLELVSPRGLLPPDDGA